MCIFYFSHYFTSIQTSLGQGGQGNWGLDTQGLVDTEVMEKLWNTKRRNQNILWRTWTSWRSAAHLKILCYAIVGGEFKMTLKWILSSMKGNNPILRGHGDHHFPGSTVRCFWVLSVMTAKPAVDFESWIGRNGPDTKIVFRPRPHRTKGFIAKTLCMGGTMGKVGTEKGNTSPGLLPFQRVRNCFNLQTQVIKDRLVGRTSFFMYLQMTYL